MQIDFTDEDHVLDKETIQLLHDMLQFAANEEEIHAHSELSIVVVSNEQIRQLNHNYRNKNEVTDVLSFPLLEQNEIVQYEGYPLALGDIVISFERAKGQAIEYNHSLSRELAFLTIHGFLHLLGYTHDTKDEERVMFTKQEAILKEFHLERS